MLLVELMLRPGGWKFAPTVGAAAPVADPAGVSNTAALGRLLYTDYVFLFQAAGLVLLVAMIGAIVLTLRDRNTSRHQIIGCRPTRCRRDAGMMDVGIGAGVQSIGILRPKNLGTRRHRPGAVGRAGAIRMEATEMPIGLGHYLVVSAILLVLGIFGIFLNRKNVIIILMSIELILLAVNLNLVAFSARWATWSGRCSRCSC